MRNLHCLKHSSIKLCLSGLATAVLALTFGSILHVQAKPTKPAAVAEPSYVLRIRHREMGFISAHLSKSGLLVVSPLASLVTTPPKYDTIIYNTEKKNYIAFPPGTLDKEIKLMSRVKDLEDPAQNAFAKKVSGPWQVISKEALLGLSSTVYRRVVKQAKTNQTFITMIDDVWICRDPRFMTHSAQFSRIISFLWHTPEVDFGIPLKREITMAITDKKGNILKQDKPTTEYTLVNCKEEKFEPGRFKLPIGYTKSADEIEVIGLSSVGGQRIFH